MGTLLTTPRTWVDGEVVTAAEFNAEVRDAITALQTAWVAYTPSWTGTTNPVIGNGTIAGRYQRQGKTIDFNITITLGSTTTIGTGTYTFSLPVTALSGAHAAIGVSNFFDSSATTDFPRIVVQSSTTNVLLIDMAGARMGAATPVIPAVGDIYSISGTYEAA